MPRKNKTRFALLGMLRYKPMSGYDMKQMSDHSISHFWNENYGNIYPVLKKMESEGLVSMNREEQENAPARKVYTITEAGQVEFSNWMAGPPEPGILRDELLLQIFFGQWTSPDQIKDKIKAEEKRCEDIITELKGIRDHLDSGISISEAPEDFRPVLKEGTPYWKHTVDFGLHYYSGIKDWCTQTINTFEKDHKETEE